MDGIGQSNNTVTALPSALSQSQTEAGAAAGVAGSADATVTPEVATENQSAETANRPEISNKAQKLAEIGREFFSAGPMKYADIPKLAAKLAEINLIDPASLPQFALKTSSTEAASEKLSDFAKDKAESVAANGGRPEVVSMLEFVSDLFNDVEATSKKPGFATQLAEANQTLNNLLAEPDFQTFSEGAQDKYRSLSRGLNLIQSLPELNLSQTKLNRYLDIMKIS